MTKRILGWVFAALLFAVSTVVSADAVADLTVPEPGVLGLVAIAGVAALVANRIRRRKSSRETPRDPE